jgi:hypothetical protein
MSEGSPPWKRYEQQIFALLKTKARDAAVEADARLPGLYSGVERQIDVLVTGRFPGLVAPQNMVVECKAFNRKINVKDVETAFGLVQDVGAPLGLLITTAGFSEAAKRRALHFRGLSLDVVELDDLAAWRPRWPTIAVTAGTDLATLTWFDEHGVVRTDVVAREVAERLLKQGPYR